MPALDPAVLDFLLTRRSRPAKTLGLPVPSRDELAPILQAGARTPDHGKLEPWRFVVFERAAHERLAAAVRSHARTIGAQADATEKMAAQFDRSHLAVMVVESPKASPKIPPVEQTYSAGAVCLAVLNAALASGWGANWLSGWASHDAAFCQTHLGLKAGERVAGFIHIGTQTSTPPERPRPDLDAITTWVKA